MGQSPDGNTYSDTPSDHILVQGNTDLKDGWVFPRIWTTQITKKADEGDLIMSVRAPVGEMGKTAYNVVLGRGVAAIKGNEFIFQNLVKMNDDGYWKKFSSGSTFGSINSDTIRNAELSVSSHEEQEIIGEFFRKIDNLITLHQRKLELLIQLKKAYLQRLFPRTGQKLPEIRFANFQGDWSPRELGVLSQIKTGSSDLQDADSGGIYPFFVRSNTIEKSNKFIFDGEAILIPGEGKLGEIFHYINGKFDFHQRVYKVSGFSENIYGKFVLYTMHATFKKHAMKHTVKATVDSLRLPALSKYLLMITVIEEQEKIGEFFEKIDSTNIIIKKRLYQFQKFKRSLLKNLFI